MRGAELVEGRSGSGASLESDADARERGGARMRGAELVEGRSGSGASVESGAGARGRGGARLAWDRGGGMRAPGARSPPTAARTVDVAGAAADLVLGGGRPWNSLAAVYAACAHAGGISSLCATIVWSAWSHCCISASVSAKK